MATEIRVPALGESVTEATVAKWLKKIGDSVAVDDPLVELETDKVTLEVNATAPGTLAEISVPEGGNVGVGGVLGLIGDAGAKSPAPAAKPAKPPAAEKSTPATAAAGRSGSTAEVLERPGPPSGVSWKRTNSTPAPSSASGKDGRLTKGDVLAQVERSPAPVALATQPAPAAPTTARRPDERERARLRMTRAPDNCIAERLKQAQKHGGHAHHLQRGGHECGGWPARRTLSRQFSRKSTVVRLGFMSFFVKACIVALKRARGGQWRDDGDDLALQEPLLRYTASRWARRRASFVPVLRDADTKSFAEIEKTIGDLGKRAP